MLVVSAIDWMTVLMASQNASTTLVELTLEVVSMIMPISAETMPSDHSSMCVQTRLKFAIGHRLILIHRIRQTGLRLALRLLLPAACGCLIPWSVHGK